MSPMSLSFSAFMCWFPPKRLGQNCVLSYFTFFSFPGELDSNLNNFSPAYFSTHYSSALLQLFSTLLWPQRRLLPAFVCIIIYHCRFPCCRRRFGSRRTQQASFFRTLLTTTTTTTMGTTQQRACFDLCVRRVRLAYFADSTVFVLRGYSVGAILLYSKLFCTPLLGYFYLGTTARHWRLQQEGRAPPTTKCCSCKFLRNNFLDQR